MHFSNTAYVTFDGKLIKKGAILDNAVFAVSKYNHIQPLITIGDTVILFYFPAILAR